LDYQQLRTIVYADQINIDDSTGDSEESVTVENNDEHSPNVSLIFIFGGGESKAGYL
jgi:hypothetical protein